MVSFKRYELPPLPYNYNALEPYIIEEIMRLHHQKHHNTYVKGANAALEKIEKHLRGEAQIDVRAVMRDFSFNYAGHIMHTIFWPNMAPPGKGGGTPGGRVADLIEKQFGGFEKFKSLFSAAAKTVEGVGWGVLAFDPLTEELRILQVEKHNVLMTAGLVPILVIDVWEHAYYLQYKNDRGSYVDNWWNVVNWDDVEKRLEQALNNAKPLYLLPQ
ncbi:superoxide dismutase [Aeropyrum camini]|uniref:Superoxide dismutase n=1 Tax=Aeropyrum camini SY1 = JCM 12091 TaxID=1198449 RepID=U3TC41_9CREN|nr:superoxide dismutase [Aeropyrum camini]BAN89996.1 superoxide dismutase [Aeropyrum camini SY1 = JCM 12091]